MAFDPSALSATFSPSLLSSIFGSSGLGALGFPGTTQGLSLAQQLASRSQPTTQSAAAAPTASGMPAQNIAPAPPYTGTNFQSQLQGTLGGLQSQYAAGGAFDPSFYMARNADVARAVQSGMFTDPYQHYLQFGKAEGRTPNAGINMLTEGTTPTMNYGAKLNNFGAGRAAPTFGSRVMPNQYQGRQTVAPNAWQGMTGSPFGGMYGGMATMPMMSFLQNSPYAAMFGMAPQSQPGLVSAPQAPQGFQIANGTQTSAPPVPTGRDPGRGQSWYDNAYLNGRLGWLSNGQVRR